MPWNHYWQRIASYGLKRRKGTLCVQRANTNTPTHKYKQEQIEARWFCVEAAAGGAGSRFGASLFDLIFTTDTFFISHTIILWSGQNINCLSSAFTTKRTDAFIVQPKSARYTNYGSRQYQLVKAISTVLRKMLHKDGILADSCLPSHLLLTLTNKYEPNDETSRHV